MAIGVTLGGLIQFAIQVPRLYHRGFRYHLYINFRDPAFRRILTLFVPAALGLAASRINVTIDTLLISLLAERSMTWLNYAYRIMHLPLGLFGIAVGTVTLPVVSKLVVEKKDSEVRLMLFDSLRLVFFLTVTTSIIIAFLGLPITKLLYERGKFTAFDTIACNQALTLYIIGIPFLAGIRNIAAVFYAYKDSRTPMLASIAAVVSNIILNLSLMQIIGFRAFPLATTISSFLNICILMIALPKKIGKFSIKPLVIFFSILTISSVVGGMISMLANKILANYFGQGFIIQVMNIMICLCLALILSLFFARLLGLKDVGLYLRRLIKK
jgi:putative peptidoglycan lipid II flippase